MLLLTSSSFATDCVLANKCVCNWTFLRSLYFLRCCVGGFGLLYIINGYFCFWSEMYVDRNHFELPSALGSIGSDLVERRPLSQFYHFHIMRLTPDDWDGAISITSAAEWVAIEFLWFLSVVGISSSDSVSIRNVWVLQFHFWIMDWASLFYWDLLAGGKRRYFGSCMEIGKYLIVSNISILVACQTENEDTHLDKPLDSN